MATFAWPRRIVYNRGHYAPRISDRPVLLLSTLFGGNYGTKIDDWSTRSKNIHDPRKTYSVSGIVEAVNTPLVNSASGGRPPTIPGESRKRVPMHKSLVDGLPNNTCWWKLAEESVRRKLRPSVAHYTLPSEAHLPPSDKAAGPRFPADFVLAIIT